MTSKGHIEWVISRILSEYNCRCNRNSAKSTLQSKANPIAKQDNQKLN